MVFAGISFPPNTLSSGDTFLSQHLPPSQAELSCEPGRSLGIDTPSFTAEQKQTRAVNSRAHCWSRGCRLLENCNLTHLISPIASFQSKVSPHPHPTWLLPHAVNQPLLCSPRGWWQKWPIWSSCPFQRAAVVERISPTWQIFSPWTKHIFWLKIKGKEKKKKRKKEGWLFTSFSAPDQMPNALHSEKLLRRSQLITSHFCGCFCEKLSLWSSAGWLSFPRVPYTWTGFVSSPIQNARIALGLWEKEKQERK